MSHPTHRCMDHLVLLVTLLGLLTAATSAGEPRVVRWDTLRGSHDFSDPFKNLTASQRRDLGYYARLRGLIQANKIPSDGPDAMQVKEIEVRLQKAGIDTDWLLSQQRVVRQMRVRAGNTLNPKLDQSEVTLAGFVVPLKRQDGRVTEFLLVPAFDFCCRLIAPAPNQAVHVKSDEGVSLTSRFAAAQVTGTLSFRSGTWTVIRDTGDVEFKSAYLLRPRKIELHQSQEGPPGLDWKPTTTQTESDTKPETITGHTSGGL